jgi:hypothetical protein
MQVSTLSDISWLVPLTAPEILPYMRTEVKLYRSAFMPFMVQLPKVGRDKCSVGIRLHLFIKLKGLCHMELPTQEVTVGCVPLVVTKS